MIATEDHLLANYGRAPVTFVRGEGCRLIDDGGESYLDFVAGIAVCALGHAHPAIAAAVARQAATLVHCSNLYHHEPAGTLANELARRSGFDRVFFCNSGAEANEAAIKLARKRAFRAGERERTTIVACRGSFHGRTMGALAATDNPAYHEGFEPLPGGFTFATFNDIADLDRLVDDTTAAVIIEPVQGEGGVMPATREFLEAARRMTSERGALLIFDEVQCGMGRLGTLFAFQTFDVRPDLITMAKALANGLPIGAVLIDASCASGLQPGDHGTTFGGSPVPAAAALAHLAVRDETIDFDGRVIARGHRFERGLELLAAKHRDVFEAPRGRGLMLGLPVRAPYTTKQFVDAAFARKLLINGAGRNTLRFLPPLIVTDDDIDKALECLANVTMTIVN